MKTVCQCKFCDFHVRYKEVILLPLPYEAKIFITELFEEWSHSSEDENYHAAILDGSWPQSVEILERALQNAETVRKEKNAKTC